MFVCFFNTKCTRINNVHTCVDVIGRSDRVIILLDGFEETPSSRVRKMHN